MQNHFQRKATPTSFKHEIHPPSLSLTCAQPTSIFCPIQSKRAWYWLGIGVSVDAGIDVGVGIGRVVGIVIPGVAVCVVLG